MTVIGTETSSREEILEKSKRLQSVGTKFQRGFTVLASGTPSIPSRFLTIITRNSEKQGFQQTAKRFQNDSNVTPGPGQYQTVQSLDKQLEKTSDSKRGTGSFASKSKRGSYMNVSKNVPAPTSYNVGGIFDNKRQDFNRSRYSSMFQKPIAERSVSPKSSVPPPNLYDINQSWKTTNKSNNVTAQAAFRSHTNRSVDFSKQLITPAPGSYNLDDSATRSLAPSHQSSFKSTSKRDTFSVLSASELPGPAHYRPFEKISHEPYRQSPPRNHYLTISAPAIPPPPGPPSPGPGAYEVRDFKEAEKKYMSSAVFVSNTSRLPIDTAAAGEQPGPGSYTPRSPIKQSFNFNFERNWLS